MLLYSIRFQPTFQILVVDVFVGIVELHHDAVHIFGQFLVLLSIDLEKVSDGAVIGRKVMEDFVTAVIVVQGVLQIYFRQVFLMSFKDSSLSFLMISLLLCSLSV